MNLDWWHWGPCLVRTEVSEDTLQAIEVMCNEQRGNYDYDARDLLAGILSEEFTFTKDQQANITNILLPQFSHYLDFLSNEHNKTDAGKLHEWCRNKKVKPIIRPDNIWVNYQKANDYNPLHNHSGNFSFVLYIDVPEVIYEETRPSRTGDPGTIMFISSLLEHSANHGDWDDREQWEHLVNSLFGNLRSVVFKPTRGDLIIFPSWLNHAVEGFVTPDIERITVAGNLTLEMENI